MKSWSQIARPNLIYHARMRLQLLLALTACLTGCGLVGTTATTAAGASAELEQAKQAKQIEAQVQQQVQAASQQDRARIDQVEKDSQ